MGQEASVLLLASFVSSLCREDKCRGMIYPQWPARALGGWGSPVHGQPSGVSSRALKVAQSFGPFVAIFHWDEQPSDMIIVVILRSEIGVTRQVPRLSYRLDTMVRQVEDSGTSESTPQA